MIELIPIDKNENPKKIGRNNVAFTEFMIQVKLDINKAIEGINNNEPQPQTEQVDFSYAINEIKEEMAKIKLAISNIPTQIDYSSDILSASRVAKSDRQEFGYKIDVVEQRLNKLLPENVNSMQEQVNYSESISALSGRIDSIPEQVNYSDEILSINRIAKSDRQEFGTKLDVVEQKINKLLKNQEL